MTPLEAMRRMMKDAGLTHRQVSLALGRNANFMNTVLHKASTPNTRLLLAVADVCGYEVTATGHDESIRLDQGQDEAGRLAEDARRLGYRLVPMGSNAGSNDVGNDVGNDV